MHNFVGHAPVSAVNEVAQYSMQATHSEVNTQNALETSLMALWPLTQANEVITSLALEANKSHGNPAQDAMHVKVQGIQGSAHTGNGHQPCMQTVTVC